jgi:hypothetical protein
MSVKRKETVQVIGELINSWVIPFEIKSVTDNTDGTYTLSVDKTYYLQPGKYRKLTINSSDYIITDVQNNCSVTVKGTTLPPSPFTFNLQVPYYFNGTIVQTNSELKREPDLHKKTPMVFLRRPFDETLDAMDLVDTDIANKPDLTFYFLTEANFASWLTADHDKFAIKPMRNMAYEFIELLKKNVKYIERLTNYKMTDLIKFGLVTQKGVESGGLFSDNYSGVQMDITLGIKYQCICSEC